MRAAHLVCLISLLLGTVEVFAVTRAIFEAKSPVKVFKKANGLKENKKKPVIRIIKKPLKTCFLLLFFVVVLFWGCLEYAEWFRGFTGIECMCMYVGCF